MKFGIILETNDPEKAWNGVRFANASLHKGHEAKIFLMSAGVEIESVEHQEFNAKEQLIDFVKGGGKVLACGSCIRARNREGTELCPISSMNDCIEMIEWADRVITF